jgi:hypothetical protein
MVSDVGGVIDDCLFLLQRDGMSMRCSRPSERAAQAPAARHARPGGDSRTHLPCDAIATTGTTSGEGDTLRVSSVEVHVVINPGVGPHSHLARIAHRPSAWGTARMCD